MNKNFDGDETNLKIRKFLKQVGVGSHHLIEKELNNTSRCKVYIKLVINNNEVKNFETIIDK